MHCVFDSFSISKSEALTNSTDEGDYNGDNMVVMNRLLSQKLKFPELPGLKNIRVELRSHMNKLWELVEQIEILQEAKSQIERLNPGADVDVEMECQGEWLMRDDIPASSTTGVRVIRFDKVWEGRGYSVQDIWTRRGVDAAYTEAHKGVLREMWERQATRKSTE